ncbi:MAG: ornithine cyclodeaminase [Alphaproteobacteria bacterium]|nr:ornithine cyclodeaminase [Alphaproteobacteria bacterium]
MRFHDAENVHQACAYPALVDALARFHLEETELVDEQLLAQPAAKSGEDILFLRSAWQRGRALGTKVITGFWNNPSTNGHPAVHAIYCLFDGETGRPLAVIDGTALTLRKTAADSALGASYLARLGITRMLMVGAGAMAPHLIQAHKAMRPSIREVAVWNRTKEKAEAVIAGLDQEPAMKGVTLSVADDLAAAVGRADLISSATRTNEPIIKGAWLTPGTHLDLVGAFKPDMRETDDDAIRRCSIFVNSRQSTIEHIGEIATPLRSGVITEDQILADHFDLARGDHPGRSGAKEITLFKNGGGGHLDLMTARFVVEGDSREADAATPAQ